MGYFFYIQIFTHSFSSLAVILSIDCFIEQIVHAFFPSLPYLLIYSLVHSFAHSFLNKFSPYALHSAGRVVRIQDMERIIQTLHSSCLQISRENSQGNEAFKHPDVGAKRLCKGCHADTIWGCTQDFQREVTSRLRFGKANFIREQTGPAFLTTGNTGQNHPLSVVLTPRPSQGRTRCGQASPCSPRLTHSGCAGGAAVACHIATYFIFVTTFPSPLSVSLVSL